MHVFLIVIFWNLIISFLVTYLAGQVILYSEIRNTMTTAINKQPKNLNQKLTKQWKIQQLFTPYWM